MTEDESLFDSAQAYRVKLEHFEGPLDLLLHLIKKNELDICEVSLSKIADQYLLYVNSMDLLNLELAGEFILVAATLMLIKSRALLPTDALVTDEEDDVESPAELIRRLLLYKKYKDGALQLRGKLTLNDQVFLRDASDPILQELRDQAPTLEVSIFVLLEAFQSVLKQAPKEAIHQVSAEAVPLGERIRQLMLLLQDKRDIEFEALFATAEQKTRGWLIVTFLSLLEMARLSLVRIYQPEAFRPIRLEYLADETVWQRDSIQRLLIDGDKNFTYATKEKAAEVSEETPKSH